MFAKKNLVAAAALMALVGAAQADVKIYGTLDASVGSFESAHQTNDSTARTTKVESGSMITSFLGFSGSEDLGGGLKAEFALETFIGNDTGKNITNNANQFWSRTSNVALSGGFGKVAIGQYDNPLFTAGYTYDPFGSSMTFSPTMRHYNYIGQLSSGLPSAGAGFDTGWINSLTYESPVFSGFNFVAQTALKESSANGAKNSYAVSGSYNAGPLSLTAVYERGGPSPASTAGSTGTPSYIFDDKIWNLSGSYDFGVVKLFATYTDIKSDANPLYVTDQTKQKIYQLGVSVPVGEKGAILASYGELKFTDDTTNVSGAKDRVFSLGYDYNLSKRTDVYAAFMTNTQSKTINNESGQTFALGLRHNF